MARSRNPPSPTREASRQGTDAVPITQAGTRLQENSKGGRGNRLGESAGESFAWNPADTQPNPKRPIGGR